MIVKLWFRGDGYKGIPDPTDPDLVIEDVDAITEDNDRYTVRYKNNYGWSRIKADEVCMLTVVLE